MNTRHVNSTVRKNEMNTSVFEENNDLSTQNEQFDVMMLLQCIIASVGIIANLTVITVFVNHKELRRKFRTGSLLIRLVLLSQNYLFTIYSYFALVTDCNLHVAFIGLDFIISQIC